VQFHWDREGGFGESASAFIRVSQQMAGGRYGAMFLPRIGQEVIVDFLDGNPDRPIVVGRVYNGDLMPPYPLPAEKAKSCIKTHSTPDGGGCNEIRFDDSRNEEQLLVQAQRRMDTRVKGTHYHAAASYHVSVGGKTEAGELHGEVRDLAFKKRHVLTHGDVHEEVGGTLYQNYFGDHLLSVHGEHQQLLEDFRQWARNHRHQVTNTLHSSALSMKFEADTVIELSCGPSSIVLRPEGIYIHGPMVYVNSGPGAPAPPFEPNDLLHEPAETPGAADRSKPGCDVRYDGVVVKMPPLDVDELEERRSFIEIRIVDASDEERGVANERVLIKLPNGEIREAVTDADGLVRIDDCEVGTAEFQLPDRGDHEWRFLRLGPAGDSDTAGA
jgi:type VI secretion system secreted protein VgrG